MSGDDIGPGDCVKLPDGRVARVREAHGGEYRVRVRRRTSRTHQFLSLPGGPDQGPLPQGMDEPGRL